uniref:Uncharacterized protein n=1 Tax=Arundo donax TaxID=35708 RepID=A0A0A9ESB1_ARUDO
MYKPLWFWSLQKLSILTIPFFQRQKSKSINSVARICLKYSQPVLKIKARPKERRIPKHCT